MFQELPRPSRRDPARPHILGVRISPAEHALLKRRAAENGTKMSKVARDLMRKGLELEDQDAERAG